ncbi:DNA polymerase III subunit delta' [Apilactobacillus bombintestini]|uniref:DNA polymerase III subunit delta' n=1 Tax=Apilactobacillus bombintestini TaxID=2419772 RepID=A0A387AUJ9_9LACO|nr:DNA polymerase III subunit delta' [Apilactobacillus bombintestini]AYF92885.1 DNA polymerase III subunit delta' [Apilactobacillus bombintestini]
MTENQVIQETELKQKDLMNKFIHVIENHELSHSYLFNGEEGVGKLSLALFITMRMFCKNVTDDSMPCGKCDECRRIATQQHPDVVIIKPEGLSIKVDQIRYLKSEFSKSGLEGNKKFFIIQDAEKMTTGAANSLLKFIEEPGANIVSFLLTTNRNLILPTIISRTQVVDLESLSEDTFNKELEKVGVAPSQFKLLGKLTNRISTVKEWQEEDWIKNSTSVVGHWFDYLTKRDGDAFVIIQSNLMPLMTDNNKKQSLINMLLSIFEDVLNAKYIGNDDFCFPKQAANIKLLASQLSESQLVQIIETILNCNSKMAVNVSFQNILEATTLRILKILE